MAGTSCFVGAAICSGVGAGGGTGDGLSGPRRPDWPKTETEQTAIAMSSKARPKNVSIIN